MPIIEGSSDCPVCGRTYTWTYHTADRISNSGLYPVVSYGQEKTVALLRGNELCFRCKNCDEFFPVLRTSDNTEL